MATMQDVSKKIDEIQTLSDEALRLQELGKQSLETTELLLASHKLEQENLIQDLLFKIVSEWELEDYHKEFIGKGVQAVLQVEPVSGMIQLAELLQQKVDDEKLSHVKEYFVDVREMVLSLHENPTYQDYAQKYMLVYNSDDPVAKEFVELHRDIQNKVAILVKEIESF